MDSNFLSARQKLLQTILGIHQYQNWCKLVPKELKAHVSVWQKQHEQVTEVCVFQVCTWRGVYTNKDTLVPKQDMQHMQQFTYFFRLKIYVFSDFQFQGSIFLINPKVRAIWKRQKPQTRHYPGIDSQTMDIERSSGAIQTQDHDPK